MHRSDCSCWCRLLIKIRTLLDKFYLLPQGGVDQHGRILLLQNLTVLPSRRELVLLIEQIDEVLPL